VGISSAELANPSEEVAGSQAGEPNAEVAGVQIQGAAGLPEVAASTIAGMLPATGQPVMLLGLGFLALAGAGLGLRRLRRR
jgi:hypothetical protein